MNGPSLDTNVINHTISRAPLLIKFGLLSINKPLIPKWMLCCCFAINAFQTLALLVKNTALSVENGSASLNSIASTFIKILTISDWPSPSSPKAWIAASIIILIYLFHILSAMVYLLRELKKKTQMNGPVQIYWSLLSYLHPLVIFFPIHAICLQAIQYFREDTFSPPLSMAFIAIFYIDLVINLVLAVMFLKVFQIIAKTKDQLASKNDDIQMKDLIVKTIVPILWMFINDVEGLQIFLAIALFIDSVLASWFFFKYLPYYHIPTLEMAAVAQGSLLVVSVVSLMTKILSYTKLDLNTYFFHVTWVLICPFIAKIFHSYTWELIISILTVPPTEKNVYYIVHKQYILDYFAKHKVLPHSDTRHIDKNFFFARGRLLQLSEHTGLDVQELERDKHTFIDMMKEYLAFISNAHPKSHLIKIFLANIFVKSKNGYVMANTFIEDALDDLPSFPQRLTLNFIRFKLQKRLLFEYSNHGQDNKQSQGLNLLLYMKNNARNDILKETIKRQVKTQLKFWHEFLLATPDMAVLEQLATKASLRKQQIQKQWRDLISVKSPAFLSPYLIYGMYMSLVNNNSIEGEKYTELYHTVNGKWRKALQLDDLNNDTLFCDDTVRVSMSGALAKLGKVLDCSSNIFQHYGWKKDFLVNRPMILMMTPYYKVKHDKSLLDHFHTGENKILNTTVYQPVVTNEGFVKLSWLHVKLSPLIEQGITYISVMKPARNNKRVLLIRKDGTIDGMSKEFAQDMNLLLDSATTSQQKIFALCPGFREVNEAFNFFAEKEIQAAEKDVKRVQSKTNVWGPLDHPGDQTNKSTYSRVVHQRNQESDELHENFPQDPMSIIGSSTHFKDPEVRYKEIYDAFTKGERLTFHPQNTFSIENNKIKFFVNDNHGSNHSSGVVYNIQIIIQIYEKDPLKIMTLEKIQDHKHIKLGGNSTNRTNRVKLSLANIATFKDIQSKTHIETPVVSIRQHPPMSSDSRINIFSPKGTSTRKLLQHSDRHEEKDIALDQSSAISIPEELLDHEKDHHIDLASPGKEPLSISRLPLVSKKDRFADVVKRAIEMKNEGVLADSSDNDKMRKSGTARDPQQEENLLKRKLRRLRDRLNQGVVDAGRAEGSIGSSYLSRGKKIQSLITNSLSMKTHRRPTLIFIASFIIFILLILIFQTIQSVNILQTITTVDDKNVVFENGVWRINSLILLAVYSRLWMGVFDGTFTLFNDWAQDNAQMEKEMKLYYNDLYKYNNLLINQVSDLSESDQALFYTKDVRVYARQNDNSDTLTLIATDTNFNAVERILDHAIKALAVTIPSTSSPNIDDSNLLFIVDNSFNDLLLSSEDTTLLLYSNLLDTLDNSNTKIFALYGVIVAILLIFLISVAWFLINMRISTKRFSDFFLRLNQVEVEEVVSLLQNFSTSLDTNVQNIDISEDKPGLQEAVKQKVQTGKIHFREARMDRIYKGQILTLSKLFPFYVIVLGWTLGYAIYANQITKRLRDQQERIEVSLVTLYNQNLLITEYVEIIYANSSTSVHNIPIQTDFEANLLDNQDLASLVNVFRDSNGNLEATQQEVFYSFACSQFVNYNIENYDYVMNSCETVGDGTDKVGLLSTITELNSLLTDAYATYLSSDKSLSALLTLSSSVTPSLSALTSVTQGLCTVLYENAKENFGSRIDSARKNAIIFTVATIVGLILGSFIFWYILMGKIFEFESVDRKILQLVPVRTILANRYLKQYLIQNSDKEMQAMKHIFQ